MFRTEVITTLLVGIHVMKKDKESKAEWYSEK